MARTQRVSKYIGESKVVSGYTFTVVEVEKQRFMVEITQDDTDFTEIEVVSRGAWVRGVFSKIMKRLKPLYIGETKKINDVLFRIIEVAKNKFKVVADGFTGVHEMTRGTWKKEKFYKNAMKKMKHLDLEAMSDIYRTVGDRSTPVKAAINDMANIDTIEELKKYWRTECKKFHPDHGGNAKDFEEVRFWYEEELRNIESIQAALEEMGL